MQQLLITFKIARVHNARLNAHLLYYIQTQLDNKTCVNCLSWATNLPLRLLLFLLWLLKTLPQNHYLNWTLQPLLRGHLCKLWCPTLVDIKLTLPQQRNWTTLQNTSERSFTCPLESTSSYYSASLIGVVRFVKNTFLKLHTQTLKSSTTSMPILRSA